MKSHWRFVFLVVCGLFFVFILSGCADEEITYNPITKEYSANIIYEDRTNPLMTKIGKKDEAGQWHGVIKIYDHIKNGQTIVSRCNYRHGKRHGICNYYDLGDGTSEGKIIKTEIYDNDVYMGDQPENNIRYNLSHFINKSLDLGSIYNSIESHQPWFNFLMLDRDYLNYSLEALKSMYNEIESYIAANSPADNNEFELIFDKALASSLSTTYGPISDKYSVLIFIETKSAAISSPLRLAFLDFYRNGMSTPTYEILKNNSPDYLLRLKIYGAAATDVQRYTDEIDARLKNSAPLDPNDPMFTIELDKYLEDEYIDVLLNYERLNYSTEIEATIVALQSDEKTIRKTVNPLRQAAMRVYFDESAVVALSAVYVAFFERAADADGLAYWTAQAGSGAVDFDLLRQLTNGFAQHPSYTSIYGGLSDSAFVDAIYLNIGGAPADADGKAYWLTQLDDGMTRPDFIAQFILDLLSYREATLYQLVIDGILTPEERDNALLRKNRLTNKAVVGLTFTNTLGNASNLRPETDPLDPASLAKDPAYRASVKIIADVTEEIATREVALDYLATQPTIEMINDR
jgi:hypothetical protein